MCYKQIKRYALDGIVHMTEFISWATEFDFYKGELNWHDLPLSDRMTIVRYELDGSPDGLNIEEYVMATKLKRIQFDGLRTVIVRIVLALEDVLDVRFGVDEKSKYSLILPYIKETSLGHELATLYKGTASEYTGYRMSELEFLAQRGPTLSPLDNLLELPKHLQLQGILELLTPITYPKLGLQKEDFLEMEYKALQELSYIDSPTEEKGLHEFIVSIHLKIFEKLAPLGPNVIADVEADEEFDAALIELYRSAYRNCFNSDKNAKEEVVNSLLNLIVPFYIAHKGDRTRCLEKIELLTKKFDEFNETKSQAAPSPVTMPWWKGKFTTKASRETLVHGVIGAFISFIGFGFAINNNGRMEFSLLFGEGGIIAALLIWAGIVLVIRSILILLTPYKEWLNGK